MLYEQGSVIGLIAAGHHSGCDWYCAEVVLKRGERVRVPETNASIAVGDDVILDMFQSIHPRVAAWAKGGYPVGYRHPFLDR